MGYQDLTYEQVNDIIETLLSIDNTKLDVEATRGTRIFTDLNRIYIDVSRKLMRLTDQKNSVEAHRYRHYTGKLTSAHYKDDPLDVAILKTDVPRYMDIDPIVVEIRNLVKEADMVVKMTEAAQTTLRSRGFEIKNYIDLQKFLSGN